MISFAAPPCIIHPKLSVHFKISKDCLAKVSRKVAINIYSSQSEEFAIKILKHTVFDVFSKIS